MNHSNISFAFGLVAVGLLVGHVVSVTVTESARSATKVHPSSSESSDATTAERHLTRRRQRSEPS